MAKNKLRKLVMSDEETAVPVLPVSTERGTTVMNGMPRQNLVVEKSWSHPGAVTLPPINDNVHQYEIVESFEGIKYLIVTTKEGC